MAAVIENETKERLLDALLAVPGTEEAKGRTALLRGIPSTVRLVLTRSESPFVDLSTMIDQLELLGRLDNGERPVVIVTHNAGRMCRGTELGRRLEALEHEIEAAYGLDDPRPEIPAEPEVLVFGGTGEWVTDVFMEQARRVGRCVARLRVPRYVGGQLKATDGGFGTGWLVAPGLMLTNHHVVDARRFEPAAADADFALQGAHAEAWFDYHVEGGDAVPVTVTEVVAADRRLDYALLRLPADPDRGHLALVREAPELAPGTRLNIVQCPGGGPLRFAIRNNFYVGAGAGPHLVRYLTDTLAGSSGSPVLDDRWQAVAMHRGFQKVDPALYAKEAGLKEIAKFHNEGIVIGDILADLPAAARAEIRAAQG